MKDKILEILIRSFDSSISQAEKAILKDYENDHPEFVSEKEKLIRLRSELSAARFDFPANFGDQVMQKIFALQGKVVEYSFSNQIIKVFWRASAIAAAAVILIILSIYIREGSLNMDVITGMDKFSSDNLSAFLLFDY